jgi:hypothetical protein
MLSSPASATEQLQRRVEEQVTRHGLALDGRRLQWQTGDRAPGHGGGQFKGV